jgi:hypothetical protein
VCAKYNGHISHVGFVRMKQPRVPGSIPSSSASAMVPQGKQLVLSLEQSVPATTVKLLVSAPLEVTWSFRSNVTLPAFQEGEARPPTHCAVGVRSPEIVFPMIVLGENGICEVISGL